MSASLESDARHAASKLLLGCGLPIRAEQNSKLLHQGVRGIIIYHAKSESRFLRPYLQLAARKCGQNAAQADGSHPSLEPSFRQFFPKFEPPMPLFALPLFKRSCARLNYVSCNARPGTPSKDPLLFQRLHDLWSDFARKYPFFFSVVHRKFKLENDFSFRLHTRTLFAFELPPETHIRMHFDMNKAKSSFGDKWDTPSVQQIFKDPQFDIDRLTTGEGGVIEMDAARALVKVNAP
jgi:hypothetical protein